MLGTAFPPWPSFTIEEADAVRDVILSNKVNYWTGRESREFESEFAALVGCKHAVALANGTLALELALICLGIAEGDDVVVTPRSFIASASSAVRVGAKPVFADVDAESQNITAETIEAVLTPATKAIIVVHLAGMPADMDPIMALAEKHNLWVIEDCAQAHGASYKGRSVGSIGHVGAWSFCQDKIMTTGGEGGMVTTNDDALHSRMWSYKDHGKTKAPGQSHPHAHFQWERDSIGSNMRMLEVQAVIGRLQIQKLAGWVDSRRKHAQQILDTASRFSSLHVPYVPQNCEHAYFKCYLFVKPEQLHEGESRDTILRKIIAAGVPCYVGACSEIYREKAFQSLGLQPEHRLPVAKLLGETSLMFLVHPTIQAEHIDTTCRVLQQVMAEATA